LCVKSNDSYLTQYNLFENDIIINDERINQLNSAKPDRRNRFLNLVHRFLFKKDLANINEDDSNNEMISYVPINKNDESSNCVVNCSDECIRLKNNIGNSFNNNKIKLANVHQATINPTNIKEFYSKIGNRLGNSN
jgi:hypothetical protein